MWTVRCVMCGRVAGQIVDTIFVRTRRAPPPRVEHGATHCGTCGGALYFDADESVPRSVAARVVEDAVHESQRQGN